MSGDKHIFYFSKWRICLMLPFMVFGIGFFALLIGVSWTNDYETLAEWLLYRVVLGASALFMTLACAYLSVDLLVKLVSRRPAVVIDQGGVELSLKLIGGKAKVFWTQIEGVEEHWVQNSPAFQSVALRRSRPEQEKKHKFLRFNLHDKVIIPSYGLNVKHKHLLSLCAGYYELSRHRRGGDRT